MPACPYGPAGPPVAADRARSPPFARAAPFSIASPRCGRGPTTLTDRVAPVPSAAPSPEPGVPPTPRGEAVRVALAGMATLAVAMAVGRFAFTPLLPMMQADAGLSFPMAAQLASANYLGYLAGSLTAVWLGAAPGRWVRAGLLAIAAGTAAMAVADDALAWFGLRFATGVASAWVLIFGATWIFARLAEAGRPAWGAFVFTGIGAGVALTGLACLALVAAEVGSRAAWLALGAVAAVATVAVWPCYRTRPPSLAGPSASGARVRGAAWRLVVAYGLYGFGYIVPATFLPAMAREALASASAPAWAWALFWPVFGAAAAVSTLATLRMRHGADAQLRAAFLLQGVGVAAPALSGGVFALVAAALLVGGTFVLTTLAALRVAREVDPAGATRLFALMTTAFALGQVAGPLLAERAVALGGGYGPALWAAAAALAISGVLSPRTARPRLPV